MTHSEPCSTAVSRLNAATGWLEGDVLHTPSVNFDERPLGKTPDVVILHAISLPPGCYGGTAIQSLFANTLDVQDHLCFEELADLRVSAHFLIRRDGILQQFVSTRKRAWHAGESLCMGRERVNDFSIGIELEGCDQESFTRVQYQSLFHLMQSLRGAYPWLGSDRCFGHSDIAPGRKTDPGPCFDWDRFKKLN